MGKGLEMVVCCYWDTRSRMGDALRERNWQLDVLVFVVQEMLGA